MWQDVIFQYDGSYDGFLCCIFESYAHKEYPIAFSGDEECWSLYEVRVVQTIPEHARRVRQGLLVKSPVAARMVQRAFLTCMEDKELRLYAFVRKVYDEGPEFLRNRADSVYYPVAKALRHMEGELEKLRGFVRFSDHNGVLGGEIEPKNRVLPLLRNHFCSRYANESFFLYDRTHRELLLYSRGKSRIFPVEGLQLDLPGEEEVYYRRLWTRFCNTITIKERHNLRCQNTFLPKRYRGTMTEFVTEDLPPAMTPAFPETMSGFPAVSEGSAARCGRPALATHPEGGLSAPGSGI